MPRATLDTEKAVLERYGRAARKTEGALCCVTSYDPRYLEAIPEEILRRDYGCGDPTPYVRAGDTVLDLGSGAGKACFILAQIVGRKGKVIGVDFNPEMLTLARQHQPAVARRLGYDNVVFHRGRIQDLALPLDEVEAYLASHPVRSAAALAEFEAFADRLRVKAPLIADNSVDVIVSNCVLNLVKDTDKEKLFTEMYRVLKRGGRAAISDIVSDEDVPAAMKHDAKLWSGCIAGAFREDKFLEAFERAGFYGIEIERRDAKPWQTVHGIEFRSVTVTARKGKEGPCLERKQAVLYKGPWREVRDDDGHTLRRGQRMAVCDKTYKILTSAPYSEDVIPVPPRREVPLSQARGFACSGAAVRDPRETKGKRYAKTTAPTQGVCGPEGCC
ncbi:MAG TPA: methyltransferase domain-containing protein [Candidatus Acidoferrales bacterium]|nr:methyltransferase domain-containing protein [Candidatus Acidoferrales bacterium]